MYNSIIPFLSCVLAAKAISLPGGSLDKRQDYSGQEIQLTFFGYPDNCDDTGCYYSESAYTCSNPDGSSRNGCQGDGSWSNPLSVAFQEGGNFQQCGIIYIAYLQKYGILDGLCASCATDHIDIWVQSSCSDDASNVCSCEDQLTPDDDQYIYYGITSDDTSVFNVDVGALYDESTQQCVDQTYPEKRRRDENGAGVSAKRTTGGLVQTREGLIPRELLRNKRQAGACAENSCECPSC